MNNDWVKKELEDKGYVVIPNVLTPEEVREAKELHDKWRSTIPNHDVIHNSIDPHGIYKFHEAGHQRHAWLIRTNPNVQSIFKYLWDCDKLISGFDGSCYLSKDLKKKDNIWTHTDQAPNSEGLKCYQGIVALTDNKERTLVVYEGTHKVHKKYFETKGINSSKNWNLIDHDTLKLLDKTGFKKVLDVKAGSLVLWDSRTFHQNQYGPIDSSDKEERIVQYVCFLPDNHIKNTNAMKKKRLKYFSDNRTTSHWPVPISVNGLQPQVYGDSSKLIDYNELIPPDLDDLTDEIMKLL
tara:strand:+ start:1813 stop:2697 length:885 start_codon:yes stop_codon:yes gene_type:complete